MTKNKMNYKYTINYVDGDGIDKTCECECDSDLIKSLSILFVDGIDVVQVHDTDQRFNENKE